MGIHAAVQAFFHVLGKSIGRHGDDRKAGVRPVRCPDRPCGLVAVHDRHPDIHQDSRIISRLRSLKLFHTELPVFGPVQKEPAVCEKLICNLPVELVVLGNQEPFPLNVRGRLRLFHDLCGLHLFVKKRENCGRKRRPEQGLPDKAVCAGFLRLCLGPAPAAGRNQENRHGAPRQAPSGSSPEG